ncbi:hypothetical protein GCM10010992_26640 [Cloacibacterium rupense]|uniref:DUF4412 domain-containing protein n=1 Tax=Cloacibacterium rupense TaxID=517423 RepID=A0ABQ2NLN3_9FLAO|nr:DUF6263 family protein [Cloacibacterium rupense]GGP06478.1 hypothetical protein GCM10010992_26640 [Cloacibacterium rupense]
MKKLSTFTVLFLAIVTFSQTYNISLNLKKGETYHTLNDIKMNMLQKVMGQEIPMKMNMMLGLSFNVLDSQKDVCNLEAKYSYLGTNVSMMGQDYMMASDADLSIPPNKLMAAMVNVPFTMKVKSNGDVLEVVGYEKVLEAMKNALPDSPSAKEFEKSYSKEQISQNFKSTFFAIPPKPVKIGETWNAVFVSKNNDIDISNNMTCKLEAVEGDVYKISYVGDLIAKEGTSMEREGMKMNVKKMDGKMSGTLQLDKKSSWVKNSDNSGSLNMEIDADINGTKMPMESKIDMAYKTTNEPAPKK